MRRGCKSFFAADTMTFPIEFPAILNSAKFCAQLHKKITLLLAVRHRSNIGSMLSLAKEQDWQQIEPHIQLLLKYDSVRVLLFGCQYTGIARTQFEAVRPAC